MNRLTKIAIWLGLVGLGLLLLVIASGVAHPNPLFNYGSVIGLLLLVFSIFFFVIGWVFDMKCEVKRKNWKSKIYRRSTSEKMSGGESAACNNWKWNRKIY